MTKLYSEGGVEIVVPHAIDVQGWIDIGYTREKPAQDKQENNDQINQDKSQEEKDQEAQKAAEDAAKQKAEEEAAKAAAAGADMTAEEFDQVKDNLSSLKADEMRRVAKFADVEYTNVKDTMAAVKEKFSL